MKEVFIVIQDVTFWEADDTIFCDWHFHINSVDLSESERHTKLGSFRREDTRITVFAANGLAEVPDMDQMLKLVHWQYDYLQNPFEGTERYYEWLTS